VVIVLMMRRLYCSSCCWFMWCAAVGDEIDHSTVYLVKVPQNIEKRVHA
jgi:hypothetical protein